MFKNFRSRLRSTSDAVARGQTPTDAAGDERDAAGPVTSRLAPDLNPPDATRVSRRTLCIAAYAARGLMENEPSPESTAACAKLQAWIGHAGLDDELDPRERAVIDKPFGTLAPQEKVDACWRSEGLGLLAAALGRTARVPHDQTAPPFPLLAPCGLFTDAVAQSALHRNATLAATDTLTHWAGELLAVHWRIRQFIHIDPQPIDFAAFADGVEWATFRVERLPLIDGDLAIAGRPITAAEPDAVALAGSIAVERHRAANWLRGFDPVYENVDTTT